MSTPKETLWEMEPHTEVKHAILRKYLGAWFGIMGRTNPRIIYIDGFCGPGRYIGGEDGSPILEKATGCGTRGVSTPEAYAHSPPDPGRPALSGAGDALGHHRRRLYAGRSRPTEA